MRKLQRTVEDMMGQIQVITLAVFCIFMRP